MGTTRSEIVRLYEEYYCGMYAIANRLNIPIPEVRRVLREEGVYLRLNGKKYKDIALLRRIGQELERKEGWSLRRVIDKMKRDGYCIDLSGLRKALPFMSLEDFLTLLPVKRREVSFASEKDKSDRGVFTTGDIRHYSDGNAGVYCILVMTRGKVRVESLYPAGETLKDVPLSRLGCFLRGLPKGSIYIVGNNFPRRAFEGVIGHVVVVASSLLPSFKMFLHFPYVPGTSRESFVRELCDLPVGGHSRVFRIRSRSLSCVYFRVLPGDSPAGIAKFFVFSTTEHEHIGEVDAVSVLSELFGSGKIRASMLPCRIKES